MVAKVAITCIEIGFDIERSTDKKIDDGLLEQQEIFLKNKRKPSVNVKIKPGHKPNEQKTSGSSKNKICTMQQNGDFGNMFISIT